MAHTLEVLSAGALEGLLSLLIPDFTRASGIAVNLQVGTIGVVQAKLKGGAHADLVIMSPPAIAAMERDGTALAGTARNICQAEAGIGVRAGAPLPDVSSGEAFKRALLAARAVTATDPKAGGTAGVHFARLLERMAIAAEIKPKLILWDTGRAVIDTIASGKADFGITFICELMLSRNIAIVGPLPPTMRLTNIYTAAIPTASAMVEPARALVNYLTSPAAQARFKSVGLEPVTVL
jgi:molybdate transport system substrate-binding protein